MNDECLSRNNYIINLFVSAEYRDIIFDLNTGNFLNNEGSLTFPLKYKFLSSIKSMSLRA